MRKLPLLSLAPLLLFTLVQTKPRPKGDVTSANAYSPLKSILLATLSALLLIAILLSILYTRGWFDPPENHFQIVQSIVLGVIASLGASILVTLMFTLISERDFAQYVANRASTKAVDEVLKLVSMVPESVFEAGATPNPRFEERFHRDLASSAFYFFFSASANFCSERLSSLQPTGALAAKQIRILVLDPNEPDLLEAHARKRLEQQLEQSPTPEMLNEEVDRFRKEIFQTLIRLYPLVFIYDIDLGFHNSFAFFRCELFESGMFLTFQKGRRSFPGSVYYVRSSPAYDAYRMHHIFYQERACFSLKQHAMNKKTLAEVLALLNCPWSVEDLMTGRNEL